MRVAGLIFSISAASCLKLTFPKADTIVARDQPWSVQWELSNSDPANILLWMVATDSKGTAIQPLTYVKLPNSLDNKKHFGIPSSALSRFYHGSMSPKPGHWVVTAQAVRGTSARNEAGEILSKSDVFLVK